MVLSHKVLFGLDLFIFITYYQETNISFDQNFGLLYLAL